MKIRYIKDAKTSWFDFEMPRRYEWHTKMSCHQDYGYYIVGIARRILHKWKLIEYFYDLVDPIVFLIQQINDTKSSIEMNKRYLKKEAGYLIQHRKK
ncbi:MAG: hypothetical protein QF864_02130, partial [SAR202 cluster bacterium]|nr:hypothetical protein [SAR202 cluster bacterium]